MDINLVGGYNPKLNYESTNQPFINIAEKLFETTNQFRMLIQ